MPHCFRLTFRASLYRNTGQHCRRFTDASCPRNTCFGIRLAGMRIMWPTHRSCALSRKASVPIIPQVFNTSVFGILSCHLTRAIFRKQRRWNWSNQRPRLTFTQQCRQHHSSVDGNLCFQGYVMHAPQSSPSLKFTKSTACLSETGCDVAVCRDGVQSVVY